MYDMNTRATCSCFISCISFSNALPWMVLVAYIGWTLKKYITLFISYILYIFYLSCQSYLRFVAWKQVTGNYFTSQGVFIYPQAVALRIASPQFKSAIHPILPWGLLERFPVQQLFYAILFLIFPSLLFILQKVLEWFQFSLSLSSSRRDPLEDLYPWTDRIYFPCS